MSRQPEADGRQPSFRRNLIRVMTVQIVTLILLYLLQLHFSA